jgi:hypothetical protein
MDTMGLDAYIRGLYQDRVCTVDEFMDIGV